VVGTAGVSVPLRSPFVAACQCVSKLLAAENPQAGLMARRRRVAKPYQRSCWMEVDCAKAEVRPSSFAGSSLGTAPFANLSDEGSVTASVGICE
jgi:hypothetical protein